jgi:hypothetical protein
MDDNRRNGRRRLLDDEPRRRLHGLKARRAAHVGRLRSCSEGYRLSRWQTVRAVARSADSRHVELGNNGKAPGQRKVGRWARALHGHRCLSGFICFTGGLGNNGKQRRDRGHLHEGFCGGLKTVHGLICGISRHGERRRNRRGLRFRYGLCSVVRASVRRPLRDRQMRIQVLGRLPDITIPQTLDFN